MTHQNKIAPAGAAAGFQCGWNWVLMMTEVALVKGVLQSVGIAAAFALGSIALFIGDFVVTLLCSLMVLCVVTCTFGVLACVGWSLGPVEAISITMLVGLSVDYSVHLAESYTKCGLHGVANNDGPRHHPRAHRVNMVNVCVGLSGASPNLPY